MGTVVKPEMRIIDLKKEILLLKDYDEELLGTLISERIDEQKRKDEIEERRRKDEIEEQRRIDKQKIDEQKRKD